MTPTILYFLPIVVVLVVALTWALCRPGSHSSEKIDLEHLEQSGRRHSTYLPLIRQALSPADFEFLAARGSPTALRRARKERRRIALHYLDGLHDDFQRLLRLAQEVARLSPEVATMQEFKRLRLTIQFSLRYQFVRISLHAGLFTPPSLDALSHMVSELAVRMESALKEMGERAAMAAQNPSPLNGSGVA